ncbi:hypothetical protein HPB47_016090 [Ixodes persulcatus]|uniref:Uncharacterized protein n=1 Tax=Ixodes persulcatus TaxID=34615 RepID=A0AC60QRS7_IXOPE|nr:hypothetical protein HPB47_016090 [Ixodes persulcatus]
MDDDGRSSDRVSVALPVSSINRYIDKACETSRCLNEAEDVYYAGHVVECAVSTILGSRATFLVFVLQTTAIAGAPHEVKITICMSGVEQASCSCKAEYGKWSWELGGRHTGAVGQGKNSQGWRTKISHLVLKLSPHCCGATSGAERSSS